jgi:hypothetical protein
MFSPPLSQEKVTPFSDTLYQLDEKMAAVTEQLAHEPLVCSIPNRHEVSSTDPKSRPQILSMTVTRPFLA